MPEFTHCPHCGYQFDHTMTDATLYEIRGVYDGAVFWQCPDCGGMWHIWRKGHHVRDRVDRWLEKHPEFTRSHLLAVND